MQCFDFFFFQAEDGIRDLTVTGVQTCALPISVLDRTVDGWRDKRIAVLARDSIVALDVVRGKDRYVVQRAGARWTMNGQVTDSAALARYLDRLTTIAASAFEIGRASCRERV